MSAPSFEQIYDIETPLEEAAAAFLRNAGFAAISRVNANEEFQKQRPRVEVWAVKGAPTGSGHIRLIPDTFEQHVDMWQFTLHVQCITELRPAATNNQHPIYRARIRRQLADISKVFIDDTLLPYHAVCFCQEGATDFNLSQEEDLEISTINYNGHVWVKASAWPGSTDVDVLGGDDDVLIAI